MNTVWGEGSAVESTMRHWFSKFRCGDFGLKDEHSCGQNPSVDNDKFKTLVETNPQKTLRELCAQLNVSIKKVSTHLSKICWVKKLNKWIPHLLNEKQNEKRYEIASMLLNRNESNPFLNRIITWDE